MPTCHCCTAVDLPVCCERQCLHSMNISSRSMIQRIETRKRRVRFFPLTVLYVKTKRPASIFPRDRIVSTAKMYHEPSSAATKSRLLQLLRNIRISKASSCTQGQHMVGQGYRSVSSRGASAESPTCPGFALSAFKESRSSVSPASLLLVPSVFPSIRYSFGLLLLACPRLSSI